MCDYSLMEFPNRLATEGEVLVVHRFRSGSLGLASPDDHFGPGSRPVQPRTFWSFVKELFVPVEANCATAVCIPPGARLVLHDVPPIVQKQFCISPDEEVTFLQTSASVNVHRDAFRLPNGQVLRLQELREGQRVEVTDLGYGNPEEPELSQTIEFIPMHGAVRRP